MMKRKVKVGILTMPVKENYGGIIQAAALYFFLNERGFEPYLVMKKYDENIFKRVLRYILSHNPLYKVYDYKALTKREKQVTQLKDFIDGFFVNKTKTSYDRKKYLESIKGLNSIIVGSDQVWRYKYIGNNYPYYFLDYVPDNVNKVAYAASFGGGIWEGNEDSIKRIKNLLLKFNGISVREYSGIDLCNNSFERSEVEHVLDPTFLPDVEFYNQLIDRKNIRKKITLFSYVLDDSDFIERILLSIEKKKSVKRTLIELTNYTNKMKPSIEEWLYHFRESEFVVTDSFHGMVFSIIFNKQFICLGNRDRGLDRFVSLLSLLNLENRLILDYNEDVLENIVKESIDYNIVNQKIEKLRNHSISFLERVLNV